MGAHSDVTETGATESARRAMAARSCAVSSVKDMATPSRAGNIYMPNPFRTLQSNRRSALVAAGLAVGCWLWRLYIHVPVPHYRFGTVILTNGQNDSKLVPSLLRRLEAEAEFVTFLATTMCGDAGFGGGFEPSTTERVSSALVAASLQDGSGELVAS